MEDFVAVWYSVRNPVIFVFAFAFQLSTLDIEQICRQSEDEKMQLKIQCPVLKTHTLGSIFKREKKNWRKIFTILRNKEFLKNKEPHFKKIN